MHLLWQILRRKAGLYIWRANHGWINSMEFLFKRYIFDVYPLRQQVAYLHLPWPNSIMHYTHLEEEQIPKYYPFSQW
jgi:hypothetical protein